MALTTNWSEVLRTDLDKLALLSGAHGKPELARLKEGERRTVTILFLDIQGFTAMSERLDPEDVQLIIDNCFKILTNEIEKFQGYIDKYEGDRMMALFGSRQASEKDCERALRAAIEMREKFGEINQILAGRNIKIGIRIGVNTGLVVTGRIGKGRDQDFTVMGDAVNLASRLETNAPPGEILISEETRRIVGDAFLYEGLGPITVKGKSEPISVYCVKAVNPDRRERWERSPFTRRSGFVGREQELARLKDLARELTLAGRGVRVIAISAQAGTGKSRLVYEFRVAAGTFPNPPRMFTAAAIADHTAPFGLFSDLFRRMAADGALFTQLFHSAEGEEATRLRPVAEFIAGRSEANERMSSLDPQALRLEVQLAIRFVIERLAAVAHADRRTPLVLHFEDLQWIDPASLETLEFLGANLSGEHPIYFLWTYRPEFRLLPTLSKSLSVEEVILHPLSESACRAILLNVLDGSPFSEPEQATLVRRSGGNPFFMEELIQSLVDDGALIREGEQWRMTKPLDAIQLPDSIHLILLSRIDRLPPELKETLMAAAVAGETCPERMLNDVGERMGETRGTVSSRVRVLEELGFLYRKREEGVFGAEVAFRHALTRDVVYSTLLNHNKKILHELVGRAFEGMYGERASDRAALLFHHFVNGGVVDAALTYGLTALDRAVRQSAAKEGLEMIRMLAPVLAEGESRLDAFGARVRVAEAEAKLYDFLGRREEQLRAIDAFEQLCASHPSSDLEARIALARATYFQGIGAFRKMAEQATWGLERVAADGAERLRMEFCRSLGVASYSVADYAQALQHYERGLAISQTLKEVGAEGSFYNAIGLVHFNLGHLPSALEEYKRAYKIMTEIGDRRGEGNALGNQGLVHWTLGEYSAALEKLRRSHTIFREIGFKKGQAVTLGSVGIVFHKLGQNAAAQKSYEKALALRREIHDRAGEGYDLVNLGVIYMETGDHARALEHFEAGQWLAREVGSNYLLAENLNCLGVLYRLLGEKDGAYLEKARHALEEALAIGEEHHLPTARVRALSNLGRVWLALQNLPEALRRSEESFALFQSTAAGVQGIEQEVHLNHYFILNACGRTEKAFAALSAVVRMIEERAAAIIEPEFRKSFLESVPQNRDALNAWNGGKA